MAHILSIDQGTSSTRAIIYDTEGQKKAESQIPLTSYYPNPGWVEQNPEEIWSGTQKVIMDVCATVNTNEMVCCGLTNQRETTLVWDKTTGKSIGPAIVWQDRRTADFCEQLKNYQTMVTEKTGLIIDPYFSATKLRWILQNNPEAMRLANQGKLAFGTVDSFLIWRLTDGESHVTDVTNASRTMLFNIQTLQWDESLLALFEIPQSVLPNVLPSDGAFGRIKHPDIPTQLPITGVVGDQQAGFIGQACFSKGMLKTTFGTGGFIMIHSGENVPKSSSHLLSTVAYQMKGQTIYAQEGSLYHAGTTIKWLRDHLGMIESAEETEQLAASLDNNGGVYLVSSFTGLGAPHWISKNGALLVGLNQDSSRAHFARAALEGICYQVRDVLEHLQHNHPFALEDIRVDGGMARNDWLLQFLADQCGIRVQRPKEIETTARGASFVSGLGAGIYQDISEISLGWRSQRYFERQSRLDTIEDDYRGWQQAISMLKV